MANLSVEDLEQLKQAFNLFDRDKSGNITTQELGEVLRALGQNPTEEDLKSMINEADTNHTGTVEYMEFVATMQRRMKANKAEHNFKDIFQAFDKDKNGFISPAELHEALKQMGEKLTREEVDEMMLGVETSADGRLNYAQAARKISRAK